MSKRHVDKKVPGWVWKGFVGSYAEHMGRDEMKAAARGRIANEDWPKRTPDTPEALQYLKVKNARGT